MPFLRSGWSPSWVPLGAATRPDLQPKIMTDHGKDYLVPEGIGFHDIRSSLAARWRLNEEPAAPLTRVFLDTFDWSLYAKGAALEHRLDGHRRGLLWHDLDDDAPTLEQTIETSPGLARDLLPGPVTDRIVPAIGVRRLLPLLQVQSRLLTLRLLDDEDKTVLRVVVEENQFRDAVSGRQGPLATRLRLLPIKGYADALEETVRVLDQDLGLPQAGTHVVLEALAAAGRQPGAYSSRLNYHLDPEQRADASTKAILLGLLDTIEANVAGTIENLDSEFLHDLRVATRRTRSALTQIKAVFPPDIVDRYKNGFAWVQQITGPVRDLDVYLLDFDDYQQSLPSSLQPKLAPMREFLLAHYEDEQRKLADALRSDQFQALLKDWRHFLEAPVPEHSAVPNAMRPTKVVADERIWRMYRRVRKEGRAISPSSPSEELHELRKSCKKLRYLMEFFASLYPKEEIGELVKLLKILLDNLGRFQDLAVQAAHLRQLAQRLREEGGAETDTLLAVGVLVGDLLREQQLSRTESAASFERFDRAEHRALFKRLFAPANKRGEAR